MPRIRPRRRKLAPKKDTSELPVRDSDEYLRQIVEQLPKKPPTLNSKLDLEIWSLVTLLIKEFVLSWYKDRLALLNDDEFVGELLYVIEHLKEVWTSRIGKCNWPEILLDDVFTVLQLHMDSVRQAEARSGTRFGTEFTETYLKLNGHFAMDPPSNEPVYRKILVTRVLDHSIPAEELGSNLTKDFLVSLVNDLVLRNLVDNLTDNFVMWDMLGSIASAMGRSTTAATTVAKTKQPLKSRLTALFHSGSHFVAYSTSILAPGTPDPTPPGTSSFSYAVFPFLRSLFGFQDKFPVTDILSRKLAYLLSCSDRCSHWTNNLISNVLYKNVLTETKLAKGMRALRHMMFPTDDHFYMKPRYVPETPEEVEAVKQKNLLKIKQMLLTKYPFLVKQLFGNGETDLDRSLEVFLDAFRSKAVNKSLLYQLLDLLFVEMFPELIGKRPTEIDADITIDRESFDNSFDTSLSPVGSPRPDLVSRKSQSSPKSPKEPTSF